MWESGTVVPSPRVQVPASQAAVAWTAESDAPYAYAPGTPELLPWHGWEESTEEEPVLVLPQEEHQWRLREAADAWTPTTAAETSSTTSTSSVITTTTNTCGTWSGAPESFWYSQPDTRLTALAALEDDDDDEAAVLGQHQAFQLIYKDLEDMLVAPTPPPSTSTSWCTTADTTTTRCDDDDADNTTPTPNTPTSPPADFASLSELTTLLLQCGDAVASPGGARLAPQLVSRVQRRATPAGTHLQRLAHHVALALVARLNATGADLDAAIRRRDPARAAAAVAHYDAHWDPTAAVARGFAAAAVAEASGAARRVHLLNLSAASPLSPAAAAPADLQWLDLARVLAARSGPRVTLLRVTTCIDPGAPPATAAAARAAGRRLVRAAGALGLRVRHALLLRRMDALAPADLLDSSSAAGAAGADADPAETEQEEDQEEVLAVCVAFRLRALLDESAVAGNPRRAALARVAALRPRVVVAAEPSVAGNAPFMAARLRAALPAAADAFRMLDAAAPRGCAHRRVVEEDVLGRDLLNLVACEGAARVERPEAHAQWHRRMRNAGLRPLPLSEARVAQAAAVVAGFGGAGAAAGGWAVGRDSQLPEWLVTGWDGRVRHAMSAWTTGDAAGSAAGACEQ